MIDKTEAHDRIAAELRSRCHIPGDTFVILENLTIEKPSGWLFFFDSKRFLETGDVDDAIAGNGPAFVSKEDGAVEFYGSVKPVDALVTQYERQVADEKRPQTPPRGRS